MARGTISKRGKTWSVRFYMDTADGSRKQKRIGGFTTKPEAEDALNELIIQEKSGQYKPPSDLTIAEFTKTWLNDHVSQLAPKTQEHYEHTSSYIVKHLGRIPLEDLKANQIDRMYRELRSDSPLGENSIRHVHKTLRAMLNTAIRWDYIENSPIKKTAPPKRVKPDLKYWEVHEIREGFERLAESKILFHAQVSIYSGLRLGECCGLKEEDINFRNGYFTVNRIVQSIGGKVNIKDPKTEKSKRRIPLSPELADIFKKRLQQIRENRMLFRDIYDNTWLGYLSVYETGELMTDQYVGRRWRKEMAALNLDPDTLEPMETDDSRYLKPIRFHDLRHSCASWLIFNGVELKAVQDILGHGDFATTADIYAHLCENQLRSAMNTLTLTAQK